MAVVVQQPKTYTGEGFKGEKVLAVLSVALVVLSIVSSVVSIRAMSLQHEQIKKQMKKEEEDLLRKEFGK